jgi:hypothetical protein
MDVDGSIREGDNTRFGVEGAHILEIELEEEEEGERESQTGNEQKRGPGRSGIFG